ncbi:MAG: D-2-hydroxyacid dehydrogenase [Thermomicrobiales bacterium]|nr:D-2-hydroxyacid dehydrogenase [Thermomicrobiales bacterium]
MSRTADLQTLGLSFLPPDPFLEQLRSRFSDINFVLPENREDRSWLGQLDALFAWGLSEADVDTAPSLKWVQWVGAGVEQAPLRLLSERGIILTNNRGVHGPNIAEHLMSLVLAFTRQLPAHIRNQVQHRWIEDYGGWGTIGELQGASLLILGAGQIGSALATRAEAFGVEVTLVGRTARQENGRVIHTLDELDRLLPGADHVAICLPLTGQTAGLFDAGRFSRMKQGACIYNIGRGSIIDTDALVEGLRSGLIGGAGLDVTDPEPLPTDHPLWDFENVIITAHTAGVTPRYWVRALEILTENIECFRSGAPMRNLVRYELGY